VRLAHPRDALADFAADFRAGLANTPRFLPCRYFYDEIGSRLFERITELPEYYLTRTEDAILRRHAGEMVEGWSEAPVMVELGSGSSVKTRRLIAAALRCYGELRYAPIDVSPEILEESAHALSRAFPDLRVTGYAGDYRSALQRLATRWRRPKLLVFLGSSLGNYDPDDAVELLSQIARAMGPADRFLLGTDLVKDRETLEAAYDDAQGVSAAFNLNLLARINRELDGDFELDQFAHRARYRDDLERVEMHLVSRVPQVVHVPRAGLKLRFEVGETIHTENSYKYHQASLKNLAVRSGFVEEAAWTDEESRFRIQRWRRNFY
jgi:dimethylhistidine N-methyltransferase